MEIAETARNYRASLEAKLSSLLLADQRDALGYVLEYDLVAGGKCMLTKHVEDG